MMKKEEKQFDINDQLATRLDMLKHISEVQSVIKDTITSDFTLASLDEQDKEGITEMVVNAYYWRQLLTKLKVKKEYH